MGIKNKSIIILIVILFLGYYQRWLYVPIFEAINGRNWRFEDKKQDVPQIVQEIHRLDALRALAAVNVNNQPNILGVENIAAKLSNYIQRQLETTQRGQSLVLMSVGCTKPKLFCGAPIDCSLGCQVHHVMTCVMLAFLTNRTLIMNWENWPYTETPWSDVFLSIGLGDCPIDNDSPTVLWTRTGIDLTYPEMKVFPYKGGITIPQIISDGLKKLPTNDVLWWNGQFAKFAITLNLKEEKLMTRLKTILKLHLPTVGILIRKRDKLSEKRVKSTPQTIDKYMNAAGKYFTELEKLASSISAPTRRRVYVATDDINVIKLIKKRYPYPKWEIFGYQLKPDLEDILKDIIILVACDFVVCSFSFDICRLVLELKESNQLNSSSRVKPIDQKYLHALPGFKKLVFYSNKQKN